MYWHQKTYRIDLNEKEYLAKLERLIDKKEDNSISNHLFIDQKFQGNIVRGEIQTDGFIFWRTNANWGGHFYPIFKGKHLTINNTSLLKLVVRPNYFAEILIILSITLLFFTITFGFVLVGEISWQNLSLRAFWGSILFFIIQSPALVIYYSLKNQTLNTLEEHFNLTEVKLKARKK